MLIRCHLGLGCATPEDLNKKDALGNTPLMLTAKLNHSHNDYYRIAQLLLKHGNQSNSAIVISTIFNRK